MPRTQNRAITAQHEDHLRQLVERQRAADETYSRLLKEWCALPVDAAPAEWMANKDACARAERERDGLLYEMSSFLRHCFARADA